MQIGKTIMVNIYAVELTTLVSRPTHTEDKLGGAAQQNLPLAVIAACSIANPTILLVDLQLFQLLRQLNYHIRSCNCFLCQPQAHKN